ncbi:PREDICTED: glutathione S-transferase 1, isoform C-like [Priapulus caudatus]|uniref:Glutathione S-transferase 1, isoform C-like n=1 Tax=Priapulus caudatus TaxID=37621 RepID=A0ABM1ETH9_PRICU|nr:PREDICTED: glutathione S-transferase 1, isoform C-like [Priapulus caudatus]
MSSQKLKFYFCPASAPCRAVHMVAKAVGADFDIKNVDIMKGEHRTPEYAAINPMKTVPTMVDGDFILWEGRAISQYLVQKYGKENQLYSVDLKKRALVNRMLYWDATGLYQAVYNYVMPQVLKRLPPSEEAAEALRKQVKYLNSELQARKYAAGDHVTIADLHILASLTHVSLVSFDIGSCEAPKVEAYVARLKTELAYFDQCNGGLYQMCEMMKKMMSGQ